MLPTCWKGERGALAKCLSEGVQQRNCPIGTPAFDKTGETFNYGSKIRLAQRLRHVLVFHYLNEKYGIESLQRRRLRASVIHLLKDPFELRAFIMDAENREAIERHIRQMGETGVGFDLTGRGIICFSKTPASPVLWSMYADDHRGLCLGFETNLTEHDRVKYIHQRQRWTEGSLNNSNVWHCIMTKFDGWKYEEEFRMRVPLDPKTREQDNFFVDYGSGLKLAKVLVGAKCLLTRAEVEEQVKNQVASDAIYRVQPSQERFKLDRDPIW
jgi:hypothetical protein